MKTATCDVVIFGSGFAGFELARECAGRGMSVEVIERGPPVPDADAVSLSAIPHRREPIRSGGVAFGAQVPPGFETASRYIGVGGTSELWSGKWRPLDRLDFEREAEGRCWPFSIHELEPWYQQVNAAIGWPAVTSDVARQEVESLMEHEGLRLVDVLEQSPPVRLRRSWSDLCDAEGVVLTCLSRVIEPVYDPNGGVLQAVLVQDQAGERLLASPLFVAACGGIESVHLSHELRWPKRGRHAPPPEPSVYTGFMDHPKARIGQVRVNHGRRIVEYLERSAQLGHLISFGLPEEELRAHSIGNHIAAVRPIESSREHLQLTMSLEQFPEEDNCILWPSREVKWRMSRRTWDDCDRFLALLIPRLRSVLGEVIVVPAFRFSGASHHAGALPMGEASASPLDENLRFQDVDNLYCASSAAFPVAGSANPTMTVVALARRLAHHLANA